MHGDAVPGDVNLIDAALEIQREIIAKRKTAGNLLHGYEERAAGYLLGMEIGRRLPGARYEQERATV